MELKQIRCVRRVEIVVGGNRFWLDYVPRRWDAAFVEGHNALVASEDPGTPFLERGRERYVYTLIRVATGWDITQDGEPVPLTEEVLRQVDDVYLLAMYSAVRSDVEQGEEEKNC